MDGNFTSEHLKMKNPEDDVRLSDGHGFMVGSKQYADHIQSAKDTRVVRLAFSCLHWVVLICHG